MKDANTGELSGEKIYRYYCIACHGQNGDLKAGRSSDLSSSRMLDEEIKSIIKFGSNKGMNAYQSILGETEMEALVKHVKSLRKN